MTAKPQTLSLSSKPFKSLHVTSKMLRGPLWLLAAALIAGLAVWANTARAAISSPTTATALAPALKLAAGTINLEGTSQAVDSASAAKLLPLWQLLEQLNTSGFAAPEEITAVVEEIQLNMTSTQLKAISAMSIDQNQSGAATASAGASSTKTNAQAVSAPAEPALGGMPSGALPMDGGGPMPSGGSQSAASSKTSGSSGSSTVIEQVIHLLQTKVQG